MLWALLKIDIIRLSLLCKLQISKKQTKVRGIITIFELLIENLSIILLKLLARVGFINAFYDLKFGDEEVTSHWQ